MATHTLTQPTRHRPFLPAPLLVSTFFLDFHSTKNTKHSVSQPFTHDALCISKLILSEAGCKQRIRSNSLPASPRNKMFSFFRVKVCTKHFSN